MTTRLNYESDISDKSEKNNFGKYSLDSIAITLQKKPNKLMFTVKKTG